MNKNLVAEKCYASVLPKLTQSLIFMNQLFTQNVSVNHNYHMIIIMCVCVCLSVILLFHASLQWDHGLYCAACDVYCTL